MKIHIKCALHFILLSTFLNHFISKTWANQSQVKKITEKAYEDYTFETTIRFRHGFRLKYGAPLSEFDSLIISNDNQLSLLHHSSQKITPLSFEEQIYSPNEKIKKFTVINNKSFVIETSKGRYLIAHLNLNKNSYSVVNSFENNSSKIYTNFSITNDEQIVFFTLNGETVLYDLKSNTASEPIKRLNTRITHSVNTGYPNKSSHIITSTKGDIFLVPDIATDQTQLISTDIGEKIIAITKIKCDSFQIRTIKNKTYTFNIFNNNISQKNNNSPLPTLSLDIPMFGELICADLDYGDHRSFCELINYHGEAKSSNENLVPNPYGLYNVAYYKNTIYFYGLNEFHVMKSTIENVKVKFMSHLFKDFNIHEESFERNPLIDLSINHPFGKNILQLLIEDSTLKNETKLQYYKKIIGANANFSIKDLYPTFKRLNLNQVEYENYYNDIRKKYTTTFINALESNDRVKFRQLLQQNIFNHLSPSDFEESIINNIIKYNNHDFFWDLVSSGDNFIDYCTKEHCSDFSKRLSLNIERFLANDNSEFNIFKNYFEGIENRDIANVWALKNIQLENSKATFHTNFTAIIRSISKSHFSNRSELFTNLIQMHNLKPSSAIFKYIGFGAIPKPVDIFLMNHANLDNEMHVNLPYYDPRYFRIILENKLTCNPNHKNTQTSYIGDCLTTDILGLYTAFNHEYKISEFLNNFSSYDKFNDDYVINPIQLAYFSANSNEMVKLLTTRLEQLNPRIFYRKNGSGYTSFTRSTISALNSIEYLNFLYNSGITSKEMNYLDNRYDIIKFYIEFMPDGSPVTLSLIRNYKISGKLKSPDDKKEDLDSVAKSFKKKIFREALKENK